MKNREQESRFGCPRIYIRNGKRHTVPCKSWHCPNCQRDKMVNIVESSLPAIREAHESNTAISAVLRAPDILKSWKRFCQSIRDKGGTPIYIGVIERDDPPRSDHMHVIILGLDATPEHCAAMLDHWQQVGGQIDNQLSLIAPVTNPHAQLLYVIGKRAETADMILHSRPWPPEARQPAAQEAAGCPESINTDTENNHEETQAACTQAETATGTRSLETETEAEAEAEAQTEPNAARQQNAPISDGTPQAHEQAAVIPSGTRIHTPSLTELLTRARIRTESPDSATTSPVHDGVVANARALADAITILRNALPTARIEVKWPSLGSLERATIELSEHPLTSDPRHA